MQRGAVAESKRRGEFLAVTEAWRVDEDDLVLGREVIGLRSPHPARHMQARPEHHRLAGTANANVYPSQYGVELAHLHRSHGSLPATRATRLRDR